ncbi:uncharacterized protein K452DRAFT_252389 [Aplosporella prunicola CBS 121167]|uniref:Uncharacterized protein n=1 Tax=Aplosporella prunicola CBS 121167 TaxID=1176127 RepID=A0A6A6B900_9PEZI|nr:uncharacterized protein K452DRAFT_252389 [Aplosporella prunicola CBS 121167]KAF2140620.1 hypothetical protein K452DRAFT_252389 [Aplosporella prunicola CBS 121167]
MTATDQPVAQQPSLAIDPPKTEPQPKDSMSLATPDSETAPACDFDPTADFKGDLPVSQDLPTQEDLDKCADLLVLDQNGESHSFKSIYSGEGQATRQMIIFVRHFFCGNCQEFLRTLSASITPEDLLALPTPTSLSIIGCGRPELIPMYTAATNCPFPIFADPTTKLYTYLGMARTLSLGAKRPDYIKTNIVSTTVHSIIQGVKSGRGAVQGGDIKQVGGEFMFEDGQPTWTHRMKNTRDHAEIEELSRVLGLKERKEGRRRSEGFKALARRSASWDRRPRFDREKRKSAPLTPSPGVLERSPVRDQTAIAEEPPTS